MSTVHVESMTEISDDEIRALAEELEDRIPAGESFLIAEAVTRTAWFANQLAAARNTGMPATSGSAPTDRPDPVSVEEAATRIRANIEGTYSYGPFGSLYTEDVRTVAGHAQHEAGGGQQRLAALRLLAELDGRHDYEKVFGAYADAAYSADLALVLEHALAPADIVAEAKR